MSDPLILQKFGMAVFIILYAVELLCIISTSSSTDVDVVPGVVFDYFKFHVDRPGVSFFISVLLMMSGAVNFMKVLSEGQIGVYAPMLVTGLALFAALLTHSLFLGIGFSVIEKYQENIRSLHQEA